MSSPEQIPGNFLAGANAAAAAISDFDKTLVAAHVNLDGDALGSLVACGWILRALDREFVLYSSSGVPRYLEFLNIPGPVYGTLAELPFEPESAIYLDCSDVARLGSELAACAHNYPSVNIDHHIGGRGLGSLVNYIDPTAAATAQLVAYVAMALKLPLKGPLAEAVALGLMTDTGGFCHGNTTADVFSLCAILVSNGCPLTWLREQLQSSWSLNRLRFWGELFERVRLEYEGQIAWCSVTPGDLIKFHCTVDDLEGLVERFRTVRGVKVAALLREESQNRTKFSLRSLNSIDVRQIAAMFGGGGHKNAAGGIIEAPLSEARGLLIEVIRQQLEGQA